MCRLCQSPRIVRSVALVDVPIVSPNVGLDALDRSEQAVCQVAPLDNYLCLECGLIQLIHVVDPALIYRHYLYRTAVSAGLSQHFRGLAEAVVGRKRLPAGALVVEFGSNDGTLLRHFADLGMSVQGIDPAVAIAAQATAAGTPTMAEFFSEDVAMVVRGRLGPAKAIVANNAMANIDDLGDVLRGVRALLADDGVFVFETQYALDVFEKMLLDVIYHEHISCFSVAPVVKALSQFGLEVFDTERIPTKGGSVRFWVQRRFGPEPIAARVKEMATAESRVGLYDPAYHVRFGDAVARIRDALHALIADVKAGQGRPVGAYGTSVGCAALIHQFALEDKLDMLFDDSPLKDRIAGPGYDLPVYSTQDVILHRPALIIVLAWRYADPIIAKHDAYLTGGGRFVVPLPDLRIVQSD